MRKCPECERALGLGGEPEGCYPGIVVPVPVPPCPCSVAFRCPTGAEHHLGQLDVGRQLRGLVTKVGDDLPAVGAAVAAPLRGTGMRATPATPRPAACGAHTGRSGTSPGWSRPRRPVPRPPGNRTTRAAAATACRQSQSSGSAEDHGSGTRQPSRPLTVFRVRNQVGSCKDAAGRSATSKSPSSSPW